MPVYLTGVKSHHYLTEQVNLSDHLFNSIKEFISSGYFKSEADFMQAAIVEFIRKNKIELMEQFQWYASKEIFPFLLVKSPPYGGIQL